jgi:hypothetical protein
MRQGDRWTWSAVLFVAFAAILGTLVSRYVSRIADHVESNFGYVPNPVGTAEFLSELDKPRFAQAGKECMDQIKPVDTFLWRYADEASRAVYSKPFEVWNQGSVGTCVSFGWGMGSWISQCVDWKQGKLPHPPKFVATEPIYGGSRTAARLPPVAFAGWSDGSYGAAAARWCSGLKNGQGGILYRDNYGGIDLTHYSTSLSRQWGAYGVPQALAVEANKHRAVAVALVDTWDELVAAVGCGYCVPICSNVGFAATNVRDSMGFLPRGGQWGHCMVVVATRFADGPGKRDGCLIVNSWGRSWVTGPKWPSDQPDGSFWCSRADIESILRQGDSFAIGGVDGFKYRDLEHAEWMTPAPKDVSKKNATVNHFIAL